MTHYNRDEAIKIIRQTLKQKTGKSWSVRGGRGTAWGWITVSAPPRRCVNHAPNPEWDQFKSGSEQIGVNPYIDVDPAEGEKGHYTSKEECAEIAAAFGLDRPVHCQGLSISPDSREFYVDLLLGNIHLCEDCKNEYIPITDRYCEECARYQEIRNKHDQIEPLFIEPTVPDAPEWNEGEKIPAVKFEILWSEWATFPNDEPLVFYTWIDVYNQIQVIAEQHAFVYGVKESSSYDKTMIKVTFADGSTYECRLDIHGHHESGDRDLGTHIKRNLEYIAGHYRPAWQTDEQYESAMSLYSQERKEEAQMWLDNYLIECFDVYPFAFDSESDVKAEKVVYPEIIHDRDWTWVSFPTKPAKEIREALKQKFSARWSRRRSAWYIPRRIEQAEILVAIN